MNHCTSDNSTMCAIFQMFDRIQRCVTSSCDEHIHVSLSQSNFSAPFDRIRLNLTLMRVNIFSIASFLRLTEQSPIDRETIVKR